MIIGSCKSLKCVSSCVGNKIIWKFRCGCSAPAGCVVPLVLLVALDVEVLFINNIGKSSMHNGCTSCARRRWVRGPRQAGVGFGWLPPSSPDPGKGCLGQDPGCPGECPARGRSGWCPHGCLECVGAQLPALIPRQISQSVRCLNSC